MLKFNVLTVSEEVGTNLGLKKGTKFIDIPDFKCATYIKHTEDNKDYFILPDFVVAKILGKSTYNTYKGCGIEDSIKKAYDVIKLGYADDIIVPNIAFLPYQGPDITVVKYLDKEYGDEKRKVFLKLWENAEFYYIPYISLYKMSSLPYTFYEDKGLYKFNEKYEIFRVYNLKDLFDLKTLLNGKNILYFNNIEEAKKELDIVKDTCFYYYNRMKNSDFNSLKSICEEVEKEYGVNSFYTKYVHFVFSELYLSDRYTQGGVSFDFDITSIFRLYEIVKHN